MFFRINFLSQISSFGHRNIFHLQSFSFALELFFQRKSLACREVNFYQKQSFVSKKRISFCLWKKSWTILNHSAGGGVRATVGRRRHTSRGQLSFHCTTRQCHPQVLIYPSKVSSKLSCFWNYSLLFQLGFFNHVRPHSGFLQPSGASFFWLGSPSSSFLPLLYFSFDWDFRSSSLFLFLWNVTSFSSSPCLVFPHR